MAGRPHVKYEAIGGGHYVDPRTGVNVRFEAGDPYNGPDPEKYVDLGIVRKIVPAPVGSGQSTSEDEGAA